MLSSITHLLKAVPFCVVEENVTKGKESGVVEKLSAYLYYQLAYKICYYFPSITFSIGKRI